MSTDNFQVTDQPVPRTDGAPLPEYWPPAALPEVVRPVWIPWPLAVLLVPLLWLLPKRMGPHFAAVRWPGVLLGHLLWTLYGIGGIAIAYLAPRFGLVAWLSNQCLGQAEPSIWPPPTAADTFRAPLALLAGGIANTANIANINISLDVCLFGLGLFLVAELLIALVGGLLIPFATAGERPRVLISRCVKLTYWSTTPLVLLAFVLQAIELFIKPHVKEWALYESSVAMLIAVYAAWSLRLWLRGGMRYGGPADALADERRQPLCTQCGYILTGLTPAGRCPECGRPVADSLPDKRKPSPLAEQGRNLLAANCAYFRTLWGALLGRRFFHELAVHQGHPAARRFAIWTCLLGGPAAGLIAALCLASNRQWLADFLKEVDRPPGLFNMLLMLLVFWTAITIAQLLLVSLASLLCNPVKVRRLRYRMTATLYACAWVLPFTISVGITIFALLWMDERHYFEGTVYWPFSGRVDALYFYGPIPFLLPAAVLLLAAHRLNQAIRQTRYANA